MDKDTMAKIIYDFIKKHGGVSFVEVENLFRENRFDYKGKLMLGTPAPNIVIWLFWNEAAVDVMTKVIGMGAAFTCTSPLIYYYDGAAPNLPIAQTTRGYKKEVHWLPVVLNVPD